MKKLYGIGTGPGAADLLTMRAINAIKEADIIFAPNNKGKNMSLDTAQEYVKDKNIQLLDFPMGKVEKNDYRKAAVTIYDSLDDGETAVFLTIGDPMIYSTFIYLMKNLEDKDIEIEVVPGIPSFVAAACASKVPLTVKGDNLLLSDELPEDLENISSLVLLKTSGDKEQVLNILEDNNFTYKYVKRASLEDQEILDKREDILRDKNYISLILGRKNNV